MIRTIFNVMIIFIFSVLLIACGKSSGGGDTATTITGLASKGPINGGTVSVFKINTDGSKGDKLGTATTKEDGAYSIDIGTYSGDVLLEVSGGTYTDEATGVADKPGPTLRAAIAEVTKSVSVAITPLTEVAVSNADTLTTANIQKANSLVSAMVGVDIINTKPANVLSSDSSSATVDEVSYGLALAAISQMIKDGAATDVVNAIANMKEDLSDGKLDTIGSDLSSAITNFYVNGNNKTGVTDDQMTKLDDSVSYVTNNAISVPDNTSVSDLSKAKVLIADLRNTILSIYNYQGAGAPGIVETPFNNLAEEIQTTIEPELTDVVDRLGWIIESAGNVSAGTETFVDGVNVLEITLAVDKKSGSFTVKDNSGSTIDEGSFSINDPDKPTSGTIDSKMKSKSGQLVAKLSYKGTRGATIYTGMTFTGSMTAPGFSFDFSENGRKISATFADDPESDSPEDIYPTSIFFSGKVKTGTAQMEGELDIPSMVWANKGYSDSDWDWDTYSYNEVCSGEFRPAKGTFKGTFTELKNGSATGVKFSGTINGKWNNAADYNGCKDDASDNFVKYEASFDGSIEAPSRPKITTFLKSAQSTYRTHALDISYTRTNTDGTVISLSGSGKLEDKDDTAGRSYTLLTANLVNQDGLKVDITNDSRKSGDAEFSGEITTSGATKLADLYVSDNIPMVKYSDNFIESIF